MTIGKMTAFGFALVGAFTLGVWTGPHIIHRADQAATSLHDTVTVPDAPSETKAADVPASVRRAPVARTARVDVSAPELQERLKPVLNRGANMALAAEGFRSAEQFATVAHASRNTEVPFVLLKHRVLNEGKSVAEAIRESKPAVDAGVEANLALAQAQSDIVAIGG